MTTSRAEVTGSRFLASRGISGFIVKAVLACEGRRWHQIEVDYPTAELRSMTKILKRSSRALMRTREAGCEGTAPSGEPSATPLAHDRAGTQRRTTGSSPGSTGKVETGSQPAAATEREQGPKCTSFGAGGLLRPSRFARCLFGDHSGNARLRARITERIIQVARLAKRGVYYRISTRLVHGTGAKAEEELAKSTSEADHERRRGEACVSAALGELCHTRLLS